MPAHCHPTTDFLLEDESRTGRFLIRSTRPGVPPHELERSQLAYYALNLNISIALLPSTLRAAVNRETCALQYVQHGCRVTFLRHLVPDLETSPIFGIALPSNR